MRLAFVSPLPPAPTGVADYAVEVLELLTQRHRIEAFCAQPTVDEGRLPRGTLVHPAAELVSRHRERPYDVVVHQMGNGPDHAFVYDVLSRVPGLLVLHDLVLHHSRAAHFLESEPVRALRRDPASRSARDRAQGVLDSFRAELVYSYPRRGDALFAVELGTTGDLLPFAYPLFRIPVEASKAVLVHSDFVARAVRVEVPEAEVVRVPMPARRRAVPREAVSATRARLGVGAEEIVVGVFGLVTAEKRIATVAEAVRRASQRDPRLRLLLAGPVPDRARLDLVLDAAGLRERTVVTGRLPFEDLPAHMEAADLVAHLRYPTARETSAALLRVLAQGRPTLVSCLEHQEDLPADAVVRLDPEDEAGALGASILALARDPARRRALAEAARAFVARAHAPDRVRDGWEEALERARMRPAPPPHDWPAHWARPLA